MAKRVGYLVDVSSIMLDEAKGSWIQAMPVGTYSHPVFGDMVFDQQRLQAYAASVTNKILQKDLDIDYDHKARFDHAAGWVQNAQVRDNGLWLYVTWTPAAEQKLRDKEYRYFSPEFIDEWTDPKSLITYKDVLLGGALTNRPFLKDLVPINLSEMVGDSNMGNDNAPGTGGSPPTDAQNLATVAQLLGLSGQVTTADIVKALNDKNTVPPAPLAAPQVPQNITLSVPTQQAPQVPQAPPAPQAPPVVPQPAPPVVTPPAPAASQQNDMVDLLTPVKLTDDVTGDPVALADIVRRQNQKIMMLASATKLADAQQRVSTLCDSNSGIALSPAVRELAVELLVKAPVQLNDTVSKLLEAVAHGRATVVLGQMAGSRNGESGSTIKQFSDAVTKAQTDAGGSTKLSYGDAVEQVCRQDPQLAMAYREATMSGEGDVR
jgi:hypothetical protein